MRGSWKIGRIAGIEISVHWTFLILIAWIIFIRFGEGLAAVVEGIVFILAVFLCIVLHELGHALTARRFGIKTRDITLLPIGGMARLERMPEAPAQELLVALGGPAVTLMIAIALFAVDAAIWGLPSLMDPTSLGRNLLVQLLWVNVILLGFNLLPAFPMDGGRVLRALLHFELDYVRSTEIAATVGQFMAVLFGLLGLYIQNPFLILIAIFVYFGAREEAKSAQVRSFCRGIPVSHAMITRCRTLAPDDTLAHAIQEILIGEQQDFPVTTDGQIVGLLTRTGMISALSQHGQDARVEDAMRRDCPSIEETEPLERAMETMRGSGCSVLPVTRRGALVGIVSLENVGEWMMIQSALRQAKARHQVQDIYRAS